MQDVSKSIVRSTSWWFSKSLQKWTISTTWDTSASAWMNSTWRLNYKPSKTTSWPRFYKPEKLPNPSKTRLFSTPSWKKKTLTRKTQRQPKFKIFDQSMNSPNFRVAGTIFQIWVRNCWHTHRSGWLNTGTKMKWSISSLIRPSWRCLSKMSSWKPCSTVWPILRTVRRFWSWSRKIMNRTVSTICGPRK